MSRFGNFERRRPTQAKFGEGRIKFSGRKRPVLSDIGPEGAKYTGLRLFDSLAPCTTTSKIVLCIV